MTNEEAIEVIIKGENAPISLAADAQEMAIEALKNEAKYKKALKKACDELAAVTHTQYQESANVVSRAYVKRYRRDAGLE